MEYIHKYIRVFVKPFGGKIVDLGEKVESATWRHLKLGQDKVSTKEP